MRKEIKKLHTLKGEYQLKISYINSLSVDCYELYVNCGLPTQQTYELNLYGDSFSFRKVSNVHYKNGKPKKEELKFIRDLDGVYEYIKFIIKEWM